MAEWIWGLIAMGAFLILIFIGVRIAFAGLAAGLVVLFLIYGDFNIAGTTVAFLFFNENTNYAMSVLPLFVFMGYLAYYSGLGAGLYRAARAWVGRMPGGLATATCFACALFGAISGSSLAATATFAKIAKPEMDKAGYHWTLTVGSVAAAGTVASLIPPSILLVIYAITAEQSLGPLLIAGFLPGFVSMFVYGLMIFVRTVRNPSLGPAGPSTSLREKIVSLKGIIVLIIVVIIIFGGIYSGVFTPTEAGAWSAFVMVIFSFITRRAFDLSMIWNALRETISLTVMIFVAIVGIKIMTTALVSCGSIAAVIDFFLALQVSPYVLLGVIFIMYIGLGAFIVAPAMILLTVPFVAPILMSVGFHPIWVAIMVIKFCELGMITPPIGFNIFVVAPLVDRDVVDCFKAVLPFMAMDLLTLALLVAFPQIITCLPSLMN